MTEIRVGVASEVSVEFLQGMADRMTVSFHKYGPVVDARIDPLGSLRDRLRLYGQTGNTEWLIDVANFAMIEYLRPAHPDAHYRPTDSDESPGRRLPDGTVTARRNGDL